jgi:hypothetical protein
MYQSATIWGTKKMNSFRDRAWQLAWHRAKMLHQLLANPPILCWFAPTANGCYDWPHNAFVLR